MAAHVHNADLPADFRALGRKLSNWGRWGPDDRLGTLNFITAERLVAAGRAIRTGKLFDLGIPVSSQGIQLGVVRTNPVHLMSITPLDLKGRPDGLSVADDYIFMPLQSVTQWDGLGHVGYDGLLYNNIPTDSITTMGGSTVLSIDQIAAKGVAGRGVLLDLARLRGVDRLEVSDVIMPRDLEVAEARQNVRVGSGDILIFRTGWIRHFLVDGSAAAYWNGNPGLHHSCAEWLSEREVAATASDNWMVELAPANTQDFPLPFHSIVIRDMGMTLGEIFDLEKLAQDCAADGVWDFFFSAPPLKVTGGVGAAITPLAIK
ncbi:MAG: cyclase family protein [Steroidobacteraceae bacterium]